MSQSLFAERVLQRRRAPAAEPREFLSVDEAERILEETIDWVGRHEDAVTYKYLMGHRKRLVETLLQIPRANKPGAACIDVGCFGYMAFWAWRYLGYSRVEGVEFRPDSAAAKSVRKLRVWKDEFELTTHNFNLAATEWPALDSFDTILFFETLEHVDSDPMGVMLKLTRLMSDDGCFVMSVPNSVSYKGLQEFVSGMPPWNYWFYDPDLSHEPRHCFEYTPFVFEAVLTAAGLEIEDLRSLLSFQPRETLDGIFAMGKALSVDPDMFGDTLLARAHKAAGAEIVRYPDCIYDCDRYYKSTFPHIRPIMDSAVNHFMHEYAGRPTWGQMDAASAQVAALQTSLSERETEYWAAKDEAVALKATLEDTQAERRDADARARELNGHLLAAVATCEQYLQKIEAFRAQVDELRVQVDEERRRASEAFRELQAQVNARRAGFRPAARLELEMAKLLCTLGIRTAGTAMWNRAKARLA